MGEDAVATAWTAEQRTSLEQAVALALSADPSAPRAAANP
jgi:hypothetical protein